MIFALEDLFVKNMWKYVNEVNKPQLPVNLKKSLKKNLIRNCHCLEHLCIIWNHNSNIIGKYQENSSCQKSISLMKRTRRKIISDICFKKWKTFAFSKKITKFYDITVAPPTPPSLTLARIPHSSWPFLTVDRWDEKQEAAAMDGRKKVFEGFMGLFRWICHHRPSSFQLTWEISIYFSHVVLSNDICTQHV